MNVECTETTAMAAAVYVDETIFKYITAAEVSDYERDLKENIVAALYFNGANVNRNTAATVSLYIMNMEATAAACAHETNIRLHKVA